MAYSPNQAPMWSRTGDPQWNTISAANTAKDGTGTVVLVYTADADNGGFLESITFAPLGTNVATVARVWLNNGSTNTTATNNTLIADITLSATTNSEVQGQTPFVLAFNRMIPAGYRIYITLGTAVAAGYGVTAIAGRY
jgi:hypothetical protein